MKKKINILWSVLAVSTLIFVIVLNGCNSGSDGPTSPSLPDQHENMKEESSYSADFWASSGENFFKINIPQAGDYRAQYTTNLGSFDVLFRLSSKALVTVELKPDNVVTELILQRGTITVNTSQAVEMFADAEFTKDETFGNVLLISGGAIAQSRPTPTPTPIATPTPEAATASPLPSVIPSPSSNAKRVVALGDSITYGYGSSVGGYTVYLEIGLLDSGYDVDVVNAGVPGEQASQTHARFERTVQGADAVLLMIGTNDMTAYDCQIGGECALIGYIESMIGKASSMGIPLFVSTVIAANTQSYYNRLNDDIEVLNQRIRALGANVVDNYGEIKANGGDRLYSDSLHLNDAGYQVMSRTWYRAIRGRF